MGVSLARGVAEPSTATRTPVSILVLLATYNGEAWLDEQLTTIFAQRDVLVRVVASDDGSSDRSVPILEQSAQHHDLQMLTPSAKTGSAAGNFFRLIREAPLGQADFVAFSDQDDVWERDKLDRAVTALRLHGAAGYSSRVRAFWPDGSSRVVGPSAEASPGDFLFEGGGQGCTFVMSRRAFETVRAAVERHALLSQRMAFHDWMTYLVLRAGQQSWVFDSKPSLHYRQHDGNALGSRGGWKPAQRRLSLIRNGWLQGQMEAAYALAMAIDPQLEELERFRTSRLAGGRVWLCYLATRSRRKRGDRAVLVVAALMGWLR